MRSSSASIFLDSNEPRQSFVSKSLNLTFVIKGQFNRLEFRVNQTRVQVESVELAVKGLRQPNLWLTPTDNLFRFFWIWFDMSVERIWLFETNRSFFFNWNTHSPPKKKSFQRFSTWLTPRKKFGSSSIEKGVLSTNELFLDFWRALLQLFFFF